MIPRLYSQQMSLHESTKAETPRCLGTLDMTTKTKNYEDNARALALKYHLADHDVLARLIFSEGLSTGCLKHPDCSSIDLFKENIFEKIAWGIASRIKKNAYDTVFKKYQFRTSFSPKMSGNKENIFATFFLCPEKSEPYLQLGSLDYKDLYGEAYQLAKEVLQNKKIPNSYQHVTNFFYPQSPVFGHLTPNWASEANLLKNISNSWVQMYRVKKK